MASTTPKSARAVQSNSTEDNPGLLTPPGLPTAASEQKQKEILGGGTLRW